MKKKKLFIAIPITPPWKSNLTAYQAECESISWLKIEPTEKLHVTVLFLGETDEELIPEIEDALTDICAAQESFTLLLEKICYAPIDQRASMIWAKWAHQPEFSTLVARTREELSYIVGKVEEVGVVPHTTLARFDKKAIGPKELVPLPAFTHETETMEVSEVHLMETVMTQTGSIFKVLGTWKLGELPVEAEDVE